MKNGFLPAAFLAALTVLPAEALDPATAIAKASQHIKSGGPEDRPFTHYVSKSFWGDRLRILGGFMNAAQIQNQKIYTDYNITTGQDPFAVPPPPSMLEFNRNASTQPGPIRIYDRGIGAAVQVKLNFWKDIKRSGPAPAGHD